MFESLKKKTIENLVEEALFRETEEQLFAQVAREVESGHRRDGLWAKALVEASGDETLAKAQYIQLRVQAIIDEQMLGSLRRAEAERQKSEKEKKEEEALAEEERLAKEFWNVASLKAIKDKFSRSGIRLEDTSQRLAGHIPRWLKARDDMAIWTSKLI